MSASEPKRAKDGTRRGGARKGAGRKPKQAQSPTSINPVDRAAALAAPPPDEIENVLSGRSPRSLQGLVHLMEFGTSDSARIAAAKEVLDRGYGKPGVEIGGDGVTPMLPFMAAPSLAPSETAAVRTEAKRYANLAILVLTKIAENSPSETARVAAHRALIERACGTVGTAKMPDERREVPLGKKELAQRAADAAATGRYATPPAPRPNAPTVQ